MNPVIADVLQRANEDYEKLPVAITHRLTEKQWLWLSDREKATLIQCETEPEA